MSQTGPTDAPSTPPAQQLPDDRPDAPPTPNPPPTPTPTGAEGEQQEPPSSEAERQTRETVRSVSRLEESNEAGIAVVRPGPDA